MATGFSMLPPLTDFVALSGIDVVLCAVLLRMLGASAKGQGRVQAPSWAKWACVICFIVLWLPVGAAHLPVLAYLRGVSSDFSVTTVLLAGLSLRHRLSGSVGPDRREHMATYRAIAAASVFLYPLALGWGDWDSYRAGWGAPGLWAGLLVLVIACWARGLRLLPALVALALLAWFSGLMESTNLWDYLLDPWLALVAIFTCLKAGSLALRARYGGMWRDAASLPRESTQ